MRARIRAIFIDPDTDALHAELAALRRVRDAAAELAAWDCVLAHTEYGFDYGIDTDLTRLRDTLAAVPESEQP